MLTVISIGTKYYEKITDTLEMYFENYDYYYESSKRVYYYFHDGEIIMTREMFDSF